MKRKILKIALLLIMIPSVLSVSSCRADLGYVSGNLRYRIEKKNGHEYAMITDAINFMEPIVIPEYLDGYKVHKVDIASGWNWSDRIYLSCPVSMKNISASKVFIMWDVEKYGIIDSGVTNYSYFYCSNVDLSNYDLYSKIYYQTINHRKELCYRGEVNANVTYYNYDDSIYWIDDYDGSNIFFPPKNPERNGHIFTGWYKDKECINRWDFMNDIVPVKKISSDGEYIYQETKLYAGWMTV